MFNYNCKKKVVFVRFQFNQQRYLIECVLKDLIVLLGLCKILIDGLYESIFLEYFIQLVVLELYQYVSYLLVDYCKRGVMDFICILIVMFLLQVRREKVVYCVLNMLSVDVISKCFVVEGWCLVKIKFQVRNVFLIFKMFLCFYIF